MQAPRRRQSGVALIPILILILVLGLLWFQRETILGWFGTALVESAPPEKADAVVVLAGGGQGERIIKGTELMSKGFAPIALVTEAMPIYELSECRIAVDMVVRRGARPEWFQCVAPRVRSTQEEAREIVKVLRARSAKKVLVVTSEFHTRRSARIFRGLAPEIIVIPIAASSTDFQIDRWFASREGRKTIFMEWTKAITGLFGA